MIYWIVTQTIMPLARRRIHSVVGLENLPIDRPVILAANHASWIDPLLLASVVYLTTNRKIYFIAASGKYQSVGGLPITHKERGAIILAALRVLQMGSPLGIFPEGKTNHGQMLLPGKSGVARLAIWSGAPVIPVGIKGVRGVKPFRAAWSFFTSRKIELTFGQPIRFAVQPIGEMDQAKLIAATDFIMAKIAILSDKETPNGISDFKTNSHPDRPSGS
jgi:1-acyl-sn-glycerol-3-phosphate acyltransferase